MGSHKNVVGYFKTCTLNNENLSSKRLIKLSFKEIYNILFYIEDSFHVCLKYLQVQLDKQFSLVFIAKLFACVASSNFMHAELLPIIGVSSNKFFKLGFKN